MPSAPAAPDTSRPPFSLVNGVRPVIILGAARSGTKLLRDLLGASRACTTIPHGINHVWRYGHPIHVHDALPATEDSDQATQYIRRTLIRMGGLRPKSPERYLVEKTCANMLRVSYVHRVLPDARFVHIVRDGRDVAASARQQWQRSPNLFVRLKKLLSAPAAGLRAGLQHVRNGLHRGSTNGSRSTWGPRYPGIESDLDTCSILEICARQWMHCVEACLDGLASIPPHRHLIIRYETLVTSSAPLDELMAFLDLPDPETVRAHYHRTVHSDSVGRWLTSLTPAECAAIGPLLEPTLHRLGYAV